MKVKNSDERINRTEQRVSRTRKRRPARKLTVERDVANALRLIESQKSLRIELERDPEY